MQEYIRIYHAELYVGLSGKYFEYIIVTYCSYYRHLSHNQIQIINTLRKFRDSSGTVFRIKTAVHS